MTVKDPALLEIFNISKAYGDCVSNHDISLEVGRGQIHALIGENGAGKSTLMRLLFGLELPDSGHFVWKGEKTLFKSPQQAKAAGIGMVHQHFMQAEHMTALDHLALEMSARLSFWKRLRPIPWNRLRTEARALATRYQMNLPWEKHVADLSVIEQQRLEILKLLSQDASLLILDEPTAVLSPLEIKPFLERLLDLKKSGQSIILISHKLKEVTAIADHISVLRRGRLVWSGPAAGKTENELASLMMGTGFQIQDLAQTERPAASEKTLLKIDLKDVRRIHHKDQNLFQDLSLQIQAGEIVGFAGVEGNGQGDLSQLVIFPHKFLSDDRSKIEFTGKDGKATNLLPLTNLGIRKAGVAWIPPDRHQQAVILPMKASENMALGHQNDPRYVRRGLMKWRCTEEDLEKVIERFDVRPAQGDLRMSEYSGGNQQKLVVGREFEASPRLLIAEHPTRGVDLAAALRIHESFRRLKSKNAAVILISTDLDELTQVCDRILVFYRHNVQAEFKSGSFNIDKMGRAMAGLS